MIRHKSEDSTVPTYRYHWTPRHSLDSIRTHGLDPAYARGRLSVVWCCSEERVLWAVGHVARHHEVSPDDMILLRLTVDGIPTRPSSWAGCTLLTRRVAVSRIRVLSGPVGGRARKL